MVCFSTNYSPTASADLTEECRQVRAPFHAVVDFCQASEATSTVRRLSGSGTTSFRGWTDVQLHRDSLRGAGVDQSLHAAVCEIR